MTISIKEKQLRQLQSTRLELKEIYPEYRYGWDDTNKRYREFHYVPAKVTASLIKKGDSSLNPEGVTEFKLMEQYYDKEQKCYMFKSIPEKINAQFFKTFKKVFDIEVILESPTTIAGVWNPESGQEEEYTTSAGELIRIRSFKASKIQALAKSMMLTKGIEKVEVTRKNRTTGNQEKVMDLPLNWENTILEKMIGKAFEFAVDGEGLDTEYTFREVQGGIQLPQPKEEISIEDIPFR